MAVVTAFTQMEDGILYDSLSTDKKNDTHINYSIQKSIRTPYRILWFKNGSDDLGSRTVIANTLKDTAMGVQFSHMPEICLA